MTNFDYTDDDLKIVMGNRLRIAMEESGLSQRKAAELSGLSPRGIGIMVNGDSAPSAIAASRLARVLGVSLDWLFPDIESLTADMIMVHRRAKAEFDAAKDATHETRQERFRHGLDSLEAVETVRHLAEEGAGPKVRVVGYIEAGDALKMASEENGGDDGLDFVEGQVGMASTTVAGIIRGQSLSSVMNDGSIIFWSQRREDVDRFIGKMVVCHLTDGRTLVKIVQFGSTAGYFNLESTNYPTMIDQVVESVSPIDWIKMR